jgi:hypothetical protein
MLTHVTDATTETACSFRKLLIVFQQVSVRNQHGAAPSCVRNNRNCFAILKGFNVFFR